MAGVILGLTVAGDVHVPIGPFKTTLRIRPSIGGGTVVRLAPLGTIRIDTHDAPINIVAEVDELRLDEAEAIARDPALLEQFESQVADDASLGLRALLAAAAGGLLGALASSLSWRSLLVGSVAGSVLAAGLLAGTVATWRPEALAEPRYTGLLTLAPKAVGDVGAVVDRLGTTGRSWSSWWRTSSPSMASPAISRPSTHPAPYVCFT
jgi:hypothetical protein